MLSMWDVVQAAPFNRVLQNLRIERVYVYMCDRVIKVQCTLQRTYRCGRTRYVHSSCAEDVQDGTHILHHMYVHTHTCIMCRRWVT
jgi:hypothetical protein